jgi:hypothetical protein
MSVAGGMIRARTKPHGGNDNVNKYQRPNDQAKTALESKAPAQDGHRETAQAKPKADAPHQERQQKPDVKPRPAYEPKPMFGFLRDNTPVCRHCGWAEPSHTEGENGPICVQFDMAAAEAVFKKNVLVVKNVPV